MGFARRDAINGSGLVCESRTSRNTLGKGRVPSPSGSASSRCTAGPASRSNTVGRPAWTPFQYSELCFELGYGPDWPRRPEGKWTGELVADLVKRKYRLQLSTGRCNRILTDARYLRRISVPRGSLDS